MKKKITKILCVTVAVALVICCCCFSASAATINAGTGNQVFVGWDSSAGPVISGNMNADGSYWINYYAGRTDTELCILYPIDLVISRGDIVKWSSFYTNFYFSLSYTPTISINLCLMDDDFYTYDLENRIYDDDMLNGSFDVQFLGGSKQIDEDINVKYICIMLYGNYNQSEAGTFSWQPYSFKLSSADENTIMIEGMISEQEKTNELLGDITADKYTPPEGGAIDDVGSVESEIQNSTQEGFNVLSDTFKSFSLDTFSDGLGGIATIYNHIIPRTPWLSNLLNISLGIGLFAFLLGLSIYTLSSFNHREKGSARQDAKYIKRDGIASHRPSRK